MVVLVVFIIMVALVLTLLIVLVLGYAGNRIQLHLFNIFIVLYFIWDSNLHA